MENSGKAKGGLAKNAKMTPEERKALSQKMVAARKVKSDLIPITHTGEINLGGTSLTCYVTHNGERLLSGRGLQEALRLVDEETPSGQKSGSRVDRFLTSKWINPLIYKDKGSGQFSPLDCIYEGLRISGYRAEVLADICDAMLEARDLGLLTTQRRKAIAAQCEILMRGFMRVGIVALVDEATGYQKDRAKDELAKILQAFVAKELQPYLKTFPTEYYEQLFRLYGYQFPPENKRPQWRPIFFGKITNEVVYNRLAPAILPELKKAASKAEKKAKLHQWLTGDIGHPKLKEHLASIVSILKLSKTPEDFRKNVDVVHPRFGETIPMDFSEHSD